MNLMGNRSGLAVLAALALGVVFSGPALCAQDAQQAQGQPARAIRLSYVDGQVTLAQGTQVLAEQAVANTPLFEGTQLTTADNGKAEIQFEDGSVARISPDSSLTLKILSGAGASAESQLVLNGGLAYFELQGGGQAGKISVQFGDTMVTTSGFTVIRVTLDNPPGQLAVFSGNAHLEVGSGAGSSAASVDLHGGENITLNAASPANYQLAESIEPDSWDAWNSDRDQALTTEAAAQTGAAANVGAGENPAWNDLDANGNWYDVPGQGNVWSPYEAANEGFDPYGNGDWMWTPGYGYMWVLGLPVGLYAVPVRNVELLRRLWLGLGAGDGRLHAVVGIRILRRAEHRPRSPWISSDPAPDIAAPSHQREAGCDGSREPKRTELAFHAAAAQQEHTRDDSGKHRTAASAVAFATSDRSPNLHCRTESDAAG